MKGNQQSKVALEKQHVLYPFEIQSWPRELEAIQQEQKLKESSNALAKIHCRKARKHDKNHLKKMQDCMEMQNRFKYW